MSQTSQKMPGAENSEPTAFRGIQRPTDITLSQVPVAGEPSSPTEEASALASLTEILSPPQGEGELGRLGRYRVTAILGHGGMGMVLAAEEPTLGRAAALKVMLPKIAANPVSRERFLREARASAKVEHENIIPIWQVGEERGTPFLAMPLLNGVPLNAPLKMEKPLPLPMVLTIAQQVAAGLVAAHEVGLIHRDIKPSNIWLELANDGGIRRVRILDFGLAHVSEDKVDLTKSGVVVGTPAYMAPEQARGEPLDHRADLFSLGVVMYQMLTGERPFRGDDTMMMLTELVTRPPQPIRELNPTVPPELAALVDRMLQKSPQRRPQSAQEVVDALNRIAVGRPVPQSQTATDSLGIPTAAWIVGGVFALVGVVAALAIGNPFAASTEPTPMAVPAVPTDLTPHLPPPTVPETTTVPTHSTPNLTPPSRIELSPKPELPVNLPDPAAAVEKLLKTGVTVTILVNDQDRPLNLKVKLPQERFEIHNVLFENAQRPTPALVASIRDIYPVTGKLSLKDTGASDAMFGEFAKIPGFLFTTNLSLAGTNVTDAGLQHLARFPKLERLSLLNRPISVKGLEHVVPLQSLKRIELSGIGITTEAMRLLRTVPLTEIYILDAPNFTEESLRELLDPHEMKQIYLTVENFNDDWVRLMAERAKKLEMLMLSIGNGTAKSLQTITEMSSLHTLILLGYKGNPAAIADFVKLPKLRMLDFSWSNLTPEDAKYFAGLKQLQFLRVMGKNYTEPFVQKLAELLPNTLIQWDGGTIRPKKRSSKRHSSRSYAPQRLD